jgi:hypothetical protein
MKSTGLRMLMSLSVSIMTVCLAVSAARAQDIAGRLHLGVEFTLAAAYVSKPKGSAADAGATLGGSSQTFGTIGSLLVPLPGVNVGYAVDERWLISVGARIAHSSSLNIDGSESGVTAWSVRPGLRHVFAPGQEVRPFIEGALGFGRANAADLTTVGADVSAGVQIHFAQHVSVDPYLDLGYLYRYSSDEQGGGFALEKSEVHEFALAGGFTLSVWL